MVYILYVEVVDLDLVSTYNELEMSRRNTEFPLYINPLKRKEQFVPDELNDAYNKHDNIIREYYPNSFKTGVKCVFKNDNERISFNITPTDNILNTPMIPQISFKTVYNDFDDEIEVQMIKVNIYNYILEGNTYFKIVLPNNSAFSVEFVNDITQYQ